MAADGASAPKTEAKALAARLRASLGAFGYQWLCACAVYPRLRFSLSGHLGEVLAEALGRPAVGEDEMLALYSLPWFRQGWLPEDLRRVLLADIEPRVLAAARAAIETVIYAAGADQAGDLALAPVALAEPPKGWRKTLQAELDALPPGAAENDPAFVRAMRRQSVAPEAVDRERRLARSLGDWAKPLLRWQTGAVLGVAAALGVAWGTSDFWLKPLFLRQQTIVEYQPLPVTPAPKVVTPPPAVETPPEKAREPEAKVPAPRPRPSVPDKQPQTRCSGGKIVNRGGVCVCPVGTVEGAEGTRVAGMCRKAPEPDPNPPAPTDGKGYPATSTEPLNPAAQQALPSVNTAPPSAVVQRAQAALNDLGYEAGPVDGIRGARLQSVLERFQKERGLAVTGSPDAETLKALDAALNERRTSKK